MRDAVFIGTLFPELCFGTHAQLPSACWESSFDSCNHSQLALHAIGEDKNPLPNGCGIASATRKDAKEVSVESHDYIHGRKIFRREALEDVDSANNTDSSLVMLLVW